MDLYSSKIFDNMDVEKPNIDQNAMSRQLAVYGHEAQGKLMALRVFIHGISGVTLSPFS